MDDFAAFPPVPESLVIDGETIEISPLRIGELPAFTRAIKPFAEQLAGEMHWPSLVADHGEAVLEALAIATRRPREWVDGLALDEAVTLASAVFEANADFFIRRVRHAITRAAASLGERVREILGPAPSSGSSPAATATPTS
ncbi:MAG: DUF6631 family protein [Candidatus Rokuibacteriota bacterium]